MSQRAAPLVVGGIFVGIVLALVGTYFALQAWLVVPPPPAPPTGSMPPLLAAGLLCTYTSEAVAADTTACPAAAAINCEARRAGVVPASCVVAACARHMAYGFVGADRMPFYGFGIGASLLFASETDDADGIGRAMQKFVRDNGVGAPLLPRPFDFAFRRFDAVDAGVDNRTSFHVTSDVLAREYLVFFLNQHFHYRAALNPPDVLAAATAAVGASVFVPARCADAALASIPWLQSNDVTVDTVRALAVRLMGLDLRGTLDTWRPSCVPYLTAAAVAERHAIAFCSAYSSLSYVEPARTPSPYRDLLAVLRAFNQEGDGCAAPRGCLGQG